MFRRPGRRLARAAVGTAVVVGTAGAVSHHQQQKYGAQDQAAQAQTQDAQDAAYQQGVADAQAQAQPAPAPAPAVAAPANDLTAQLQQLSQLHNAGVLSDEEFAAAKAKVLGS
jgi:hypothetical protein